jgi:hypothetical protein
VILLRYAGGLYPEENYVEQGCGCLLRFSAGENLNRKQIPRFAQDDSKNAFCGSHISRFTAKRRKKADC